MASSLKWFQQGLGTRIDAFEVALKATAGGEREAASTIRQLAQSLLKPASKFGFDGIYVAARALADSADDLVVERATQLVHVLREEAAKAKAWSSVILLIGGDAEMNARIASRLNTARRVVIEARTAAEAQTALREKIVVFIILSIFLPDADGRAFLVRLKENPLTASIPILVLSPKLSDDTRLESLMSADSFIELPVDPDEVASRVRSRLRRAHESMKEAHRDPLTGLLNRAAFREQFSKVLDACRVAQDPLAFAILSIDDARHILNTDGLMTSEEIVQRVGALLSSALRATDIVGRWGVHEFAALFPGEDQFGGTRAIDKIRDLLRAESFRAPDGRSFHITLSAGLTLAGADATLDTIASDADRHLFQAQSAGGNRVVSDNSNVPKRTERVLVMLQDPVAARVLRHLFEKEGFVMTHVSDADEGIAAAAGRQRYHLILVDEQIPGRDGFETLQELRRMPRNNRVPIVVLISRHSPQSIVRALEMGANDYVILPLSPLSFMTHMRRLLSRGEASRPTGGRSKSLLIVDPDTQTLMLAATSLQERGGYRILLSRGGHDAIQRFDDERPDALILPASQVLGGEKAALVVLFETATHQHCPVILTVTSNAEAEAVGRLERGVAGMLRKPLNPLGLAAEVENTLGAPAAGQQLPQATAHLNTEIRRVLQA